MVKILLVRPNFKIRQTYPPLGIAYIAAWLRKQNPRYTIRIVDGLRDKLQREDFKQIFLKFKPDILGITSMDLSSCQTHEIAGIAKAIDRNCNVVVGGPYPTGAPQEVLGDENIDFIVVGEGEKAMGHLVEALTRDRSPSLIKGIGYKTNGKFVLNQPLDYIDDINSIPFPAWDLVGLKDYYVFNNVPVPVLTTRGCHYNCIYCLDIFGKKVRYRSVDNLLQELILLVNEYKIDHITITDDIFNIDQKRVMEFCDYIISLRLNINIFIGYGLKLEFMNNDIISKLKEAGVYWVTYGIEPASKRIQRLIGMDFNPTHARRIIDFSTRAGLLTEGIVAIGAPGETEKEIQETIRYVNSTGLHRANFVCVSSFFPKVKLRSLPRGTHIENSNRLPDSIDFVCDNKLKKIQKKAYMSFYCDLPRLWRIVRITKDKFRLMKELLSFLKYIITGQYI